MSGRAVVRCSPTGGPSVGGLELQICVWHESFPAAEDPCGRMYTACRGSVPCHHCSVLDCRVIHTDGSFRTIRNGRDGAFTVCVPHPVRRPNSAVPPREHRRATGARLCPMVQLTPPRVAENARTREWTQGTSGVGHGEHAMATSETPDGPEPPSARGQPEAAAEPCTVRRSIARQPCGPVDGCES